MLPADVSVLGTFKGKDGADGEKGDTGSLAFATAEKVTWTENPTVSMIGPESARGAHFKIPIPIPTPEAVNNDTATAALLSNPTETQKAADANTFRVAPNIPARAVVEVEQLRAASAASYQATPTYDGSGESVHPDVLYFPLGWNGYRYWMAMTPYPNGDDTVENPSILASHDGNTWVVPAGLTNPIAAPDFVGYYPDPELTYDPETGRVYCIWIGRMTEAATPSVLASYSTDGVTWAPKYELFAVEANEVSPSAAIIGGEVWVWTPQKTDAGPHKLWLRKGTTLDGSGTWAASECTFPTPDGLGLWHIDVADFGGQFIAVAAFCARNLSGTNARLHAMTSADGATWSVSAQPIIAPTAGAWDGDLVYRACIVPRSDLPGSIGDIWYSARAVSAGTAVWHIGRTRLEVMSDVEQRTAPLNRVARHRDTIEAAPAGRNLLPVNPGLREKSRTAVSPDGWSYVAGGATGASFDRDAFSYVAAAATTSITNTNNLVPVTPWVQYTVSAEVAGESGAAAQVTLVFLDADGAVISTHPTGGIALPEGQAFTRLSVTRTAPVGATHLRMTLATFEASSDRRIWWRNAQAETGVVPTEWTSGTGLVIRAGAKDAIQVLGPLDPVLGERVLFRMDKDGFFQAPYQAPVETGVNRTVLPHEYQAFIANPGCSRLNLPQGNLVELGRVVTLVNRSGASIDIGSASNGSTAYPIDGTTTKPLADGATGRYMFRGTEWLVI